MCVCVCMNLYLFQGHITSKFLLVAKDFLRFQFFALNLPTIEKEIF